MVEDGKKDTENLLEKLKQDIQKEKNKCVQHVEQQKQEK